MEDLRVIDTKAHGVLDYLVGATLVAAPWIFQFQGVDAAMWVAIGSGLALIGMSALTNYELSVAKLVPMHVHLAADAVLGLFLALSPWVFGFADEGTNAWLPYVLIGLAELVVTALSSPWPRRPDEARREERLMRHAT